MDCPRPEDINSLRESIAQSAADVAVALLGEPNRKLCSNRELRFGNKGSFAIVTEGPKAGHWYDHENGEGGDLFRLIQRVHRCSFGEVIAYASHLLENASPAARHSTRATAKAISPERETTAAYALQLFWEAKPIVGTPAVGYLDWREILQPAFEAGDAVIRFHPNAPFGRGSRCQCMLALLRDIITDEPRAVQRTALSPDLMRAISQTSCARFKEAGGKIDRMSLGPKAGTAIKLCSHEAVSEGLVVGEGLETVLAAMRLGLRPAWALGGTSEPKSFPVLSGIEALTILVDNDANGAGQNAAAQCSARWLEAGQEVFRAVPNHTGDDFNDVIRWRGT
jgi:putative DNA primase/helicase